MVLGGGVSYLYIYTYMCIYSSYRGIWGFMMQCRGLSLVTNTALRRLGRLRQARKASSATAPEQGSKAQQGIIFRWTASFRQLSGSTGHALHFAPAQYCNPRGFAAVSEPAECVSRCARPVKVGNTSQPISRTGIRVSQRSEFQNPCSAIGIPSGFDASSHAIGRKQVLSQLRDASLTRSAEI